MKLIYHFDGTHNFLLFRGKTLLDSPAGAWCNYSPPQGGQPGVVLMMYATKESRIYAPILLGVLGLHALETYGELPVGSHDLSCHSFPIQKRLATILGQLPASSPVNFEDWFKSKAYVQDWAQAPVGTFDELPISALADGKNFLMEIVRSEKKDQIQPAFEGYVDEFSSRRRANGLAFDDFVKKFRTQNSVSSL